MSNHPALDRMALPPPSTAHLRRMAYNQQAGYIFTPTAFVVSVIIATVAIAMLITLVAVAPRMVTIPLVGTVVVSLLAMPFLRRNRRWAPRTLAIVSALPVIAMILVLTALALPETARIVIAATGIAGLLVFRVAAFHGGWDPRSALRPVPASTRSHKPASPAAGTITAG